MTPFRFKNLLEYPKEHWHPPFYYNPTGSWVKLKRAFYRFFDLQFGTILTHLSACLPQVKGTVLDVGCGIQPYRHLFSPSVRYIGLDSIDSKNHFGYETPDTLYFSGDKWPVKDHKADFILCTETLEHVPRPAFFLKEAYRCLRPGGSLLLTVPFQAHWHFIPYDYWRFTPSGFGQLLGEAGFIKVRVYARGNQLTVSCYKTMAFIYSLLHPLSSNFFFEWFCRLTGFLALPLFLVNAVLANLTLGQEGSVDCLGYTVIADKPSGAKGKKR